MIVPGGPQGGTGRGRRGVWKPAGAIAVVLAAVAALLEFIPLLGPLTAGILIVIVAGVTGAPVVTVLIFDLGFGFVFLGALGPQGMERAQEKRQQPQGVHGLARTSSHVLSAFNQIWESGSDRLR